MICLFQDDHSLKKKITFLKQVLAVQNEVGLSVIMSVLLCNEVHKFIGPSPPTTVCQPISLIVFCHFFRLVRVYLSVCLSVYCRRSLVSQ